MDDEFVFGLVPCDSKDLTTVEKTMTLSNGAVVSGVFLNDVLVFGFVNYNNNVYRAFDDIEVRQLL
jgi:hypothetical protein